LYQWTV